EVDPRLELRIVDAGVAQLRLQRPAQLLARGRIGLVEAAVAVHRRARLLDQAMDVLLQHEDRDVLIREVPEQPEQREQRDAHRVEPARRVVLDWLGHARVLESLAVVSGCAEKTGGPIWGLWTPMSAFTGGEQGAHRAARAGTGHLASPGGVETLQRLAGGSESSNCTS